MSDLKPIPGELRATIHITRKATGKTETFELVGHSDPEKLAAIMKARKALNQGEMQNVGDPLDDRA